MRAVSGGPWPYEALKTLKIDAFTGDSTDYERSVYPLYCLFSCSAEKGQCTGVSQIKRAGRGPVS